MHPPEIGQNYFDKITPHQWKIAKAIFYREARALILKQKRNAFLCLTCFSGLLIVLYHMNFSELLGFIYAGFMASILGTIIHHQQMKDQEKKGFDLWWNMLEKGLDIRTSLYRVENAYDDEEPLIIEIKKKPSDKN